LAWRKTGPKSAHLKVELEGTQKVHTSLKPDRNSLTQKLSVLLIYTDSSSHVTGSLYFTSLQILIYIYKVRKRNTAGKRGDKNKFGNGKEENEGRGKGRMKLERQKKGQKMERTGLRRV